MVALSSADAYIWHQASVHCSEQCHWLIWSPKKLFSKFWEMVRIKPRAAGREQTWAKFRKLQNFAEYLMPIFRRYEFCKVKDVFRSMLSHKTWAKFRRYEFCKKKLCFARVWQRGKSSTSAFCCTHWKNIFELLLLSTLISAMNTHSFVISVCTFTNKS